MEHANTHLGYKPKHIQSSIFSGTRLCHRVEDASPVEVQASQLSLIHLEQYNVQIDRSWFFGKETVLR
jgi:hypothetical protein